MVVVDWRGLPLNTCLLFIYMVTVFLRSANVLLRYIVILPWVAGE